MYKIYFGTYSKGENGGIFYGNIDENNGIITIDGNIETENPSYLCISEDKKFLYAALELDSGKICSIDLAEKIVTSEASTNGKHPCHISTDGDNLFAANYSEGTLIPYKINSDRTIKPSNRSFYHYGSSINLQRQSKPYMHFSKLTPDKRYLAVCDLGSDMVVLYPYDEYFGISSNVIEIKTPEGSGPRHLDFSADGKYMYIAAELGNEVLVYENFAYDYRLKQRISTLDNKDKKSSVAAIKISPDKKHLAVSNRGCDNIAYFKIQPDGTLILLNHYPTGKIPRDLTFTPDGKWLVYVDQEGGTAGVYSVEGDMINRVSLAEIKLPSPVCVLVI